jgi:hypothetical protein
MDSETVGFYALIAVALLVLLALSLLIARLLQGRADSKRHRRLAVSQLKREWTEGGE